MDFLSQLMITNIIDYTVFTYYLGKLFNTYKLNRNYEEGKIKKIVLPKELQAKHNIINQQTIDSRNFIKYIDKFIYVITTNFKKEDLTYFYNNVRTLRVFPDYFLLKKDYKYGDILGFYMAAGNYIAYKKDLVEQIIYHELFHMASSVYEYSYIHSGFSHTNLDTKDRIGKGLNEGYTELLSNRYFSLENAPSSYYLESVLAKGVELLIGKEKMESLYLTSNLNGLIDELAKYSDKEKVEVFLSGIDNLTDSKLVNIRKCMNDFSNLILFLNSCNIKRAIKLKKDGTIKSTEELIDFLADYLSSFYIVIEGVKVNLISIKEVLIENLNTLEEIKPLIDDYKKTDNENNLTLKL